MVFKKTKHHLAQAITLMELLIVIAVLATLSTIAYFAINPGRWFTDVNATRRLADMQSLEKSFDSYRSEHQGAMPGAYNGSPAQLGTAVTGCNLDCNIDGELVKLPDACLDFRSALSAYLPELPVRRNQGSPEKTGYAVMAKGRSVKVYDCYEGSNTDEISADCVPSCVGKCAGQLDSCGLETCPEPVLNAPGYLTANSNGVITWESKNSSYLLYRNTVNNISSASLVVSLNTNTYQDDDVISGATYYYWVKATLADCAKVSDYSGVASMTADCPNGICEYCTQDANCTTCQQCLANRCVNQSAGNDLKNDCADIVCGDFVSGWYGNYCQRFDKAKGNNGKCNGLGQCANTLPEICSGAINLAVCQDTGCKRPDPVCALGSASSDNDLRSEICFVSGEAGTCPAGFVCNSDASCVCGGQPIPPSGLTLTAKTQQITASWNAVSGATGYKLYVFKNNTWQIIYQGANRNFVHSGLANGTMYSYGVSATTCGGDSIRSWPPVVAFTPVRDFSPLCSNDSKVGDTCGGGWLICKPNDGNCGENKNYYLIASPLDITNSNWLTADNTCYNANYEGYDDWRLPSHQGVNSKSELCQTIRRSNLCQNMNAKENWNCQGGCLSPTPIDNVNVKVEHWSSSQNWFLNNSGVYGINSGGLAKQTFRCVRVVTPLF